VAQSAELAPEHALARLGVMDSEDDLVWMRAELPWLDSGFLGRIPPERAGGVGADLERLGFTVYALDGSRMRTAAQCYAEITRAFDFWGDWQGNPDAFTDFMSDVELPRRAAVVWTSTRTLAAADPVAFARVVSLLILTQEGTPAASQLEILLSE